MKWLPKGLVIVLFLCIIFGIYNFCTNPQFLTASLTSIVTIAIALIVSYFLVQRKTDDRRKREKIDRLLYKIQDTILDKDFLEINTTDLITHRSVANKIEYLEDNVTGDIKKKISRIKELFEEYREFYSNHYTDKEYMEKSLKELTNYVARIDDLCDEVHLMLL